MSLLSSGVALHRPPAWAGALNSRLGIGGTACLLAGTSVALGLSVAVGLDPSLILAVLLFALAVILSVRRYVILLTVTLLVFLSASFSVLRLPHVDSIRWGLLVAMVVIGGLRVTQSPLHARHEGVPRALVLFCVVAVASTAWSIVPGVTLGRALTFLMLVILAVLIRRMGVGTSDFLSAVRALGIFLAVGNGVAGLAGIRAFQGRFAGMFENPNSMSVANALVFPAVLNAAIEAPSRRWRLIWATTSLALAGQAVVAGSRAGIAAMGAGYVYQLARHFARRPRRGKKRGSLADRRGLTIALPAAVALWLAFSASGSHRLSIVNTRSSLWSVFGEVFKERWLLGHGFGTTERTLVPYGSRIGFPGPTGVDFHNSYFNLLTDLGVVGAALLILALVLTIARCPDKNAALVGIVVVGLVSAVFESWLYAVGSGFPIIFWLALLHLRQQRLPGATMQATTGTKPTHPRFSASNA